MSLKCKEKDYISRFTNGAANGYDGKGRPLGVKKKS